MTLRELVERLSTVRVVLAGQVFEARVLQAIETDLIGRLYPRPEPPLVPDLEAGSKAPPVPNPKDPAFIADRDGWFTDSMVLCIAAAVGGRQLGIALEWPEVTHATHRSAEVREAARKYLEAAHPIMVKLSAGDLNRAFDAVTNGGSSGSGGGGGGADGGGVEEAAKN